VGDDRRQICAVNLADTVPTVSSLSGSDGFPERTWVTPLVYARTYSRHATSRAAITNPNL
jgi:hypothetical protein